MLDEGLVHILATDAHTTRRRAPLLAEGKAAAVKFVGEEEAERLVVERRKAIIDNIAPKKCDRSRRSAMPKTSRDRVDSFGECWAAERITSACRGCPRGKWLYGLSRRSAAGGPDLEFRPV